MITVVHFSKAFYTRTLYDVGRRIPSTEYSRGNDWEYYPYTEYHAYYFIYSTEYGNVRY